MPLRLSVSHCTHTEPGLKHVGGLLTSCSGLCTCSQACEGHTLGLTFMLRSSSSHEWIVFTAAVNVRISHQERFVYFFSFPPKSFSPCCTSRLTKCKTSHKLLLKACKAVHKWNRPCLPPPLQGEIDCIIWLINWGEGWWGTYKESQCIYENGIAPSRQLHTRNQFKERLESAGRWIVQRAISVLWICYLFACKFFFVVFFLFLVPFSTRSVRAPASNLCVACKTGGECYNTWIREKNELPSICAAGVLSACWEWNDRNKGKEMIRHF